MAASEGPSAALFPNARVFVDRDIHLESMPDHGQSVVPQRTLTEPRFHSACGSGAFRPAGTAHPGARATSVCSRNVPPSICWRRDRLFGSLRRLRRLHLLEQAQRPSGESRCADEAWREQPHGDRCLACRRAEIRRQTDEMLARGSIRSPPHERIENGRPQGPPALHSGQPLAGFKDGGSVSSIRRPASASPACADASRRPCRQSPAASSPR